jgi:hypothetical protein
MGEDEVRDDLRIRKIATFSEDVFIEGGKAGGPVRMSAVAAVVANPWLGDFEPNLRPLILSFAPRIAERIVPMLLDACGGGDRIEAYGKSAIVGTAGEIEHASGLIHTLRFGNIFRESVKGKTFLPFTNTRGGAGAPIMIPLSDKHDEGRRSHYMTVSFNIMDAPAADEILVAIGASTGGRLHPRIGDRYLDMKEMEIAPAS